MSILPVKFVKTTQARGIYVIYGRYRRAAETPSGWRNCGLRSQFERESELAALTVTPADAASTSFPGSAWERGSLQAPPAFRGRASNAACFQAEPGNKQSVAISVGICWSYDQGPSWRRITRSTLFRHGWAIRPKSSRSTTCHMDSQETTKALDV